MVAPLVSLALAAAAVGAAAELPPRFSVSSTAVAINDSVTVRVVRPAQLGRREIRLYAAPAEAAGALRSRFDQRLSYLGSVSSVRGARVVVTVPPLAPGRYALAWWCRGCFRLRDGIGLQRSSALVLESASGSECPVTLPNENRPPGAPKSWRFHGNDRLWAALPPDGVLRTNSLGGHKQIWAGRIGAGAPLTVQYRPFGDPSTPFTTASVVSGTLVGYTGTSWASRMGFQPGCWEISARQLDVSLSYVTRVVVPTAP